MKDRRQLKRLVEAGEYRPEPERVAQAMLRRRGVRVLLAGSAALSAADRIQSPSPGRRQAA